jgi:hypothetical protein
MRLIGYGTVLLMSLTLMGCGMMPEPKVLTVTKTVQTQVPIQARPKQVQLNDVKIWVVSKVNFDEFVKEYEKKNGRNDFLMVSIKSSEFNEFLTKAYK